MDIPDQTIRIKAEATGRRFLGLTMTRPLMVVIAASCGPTGICTLREVTNQLSWTMRWGHSTLGAFFR
jgi:hypothetical protein